MIADTLYFDPILETVTGGVIPGFMMLSSGKI